LYIASLDTKVKMRYNPTGRKTWELVRGASKKKCLDTTRLRAYNKNARSNGYASIVLVHAGNPRGKAGIHGIV
jgi:hypothetical protein